MLSLSVHLCMLLTSCGGDVRLRLMENAVVDLENLAAIDEMAGVSRGTCGSRQQALEALRSNDTAWAAAACWGSVRPDSEYGAVFWIEQSPAGLMAHGIADFNRDGRVAEVVQVFGARPAWIQSD